MFVESFVVWVLALLAAVPVHFHLKSMAFLQKIGIDIVTKEVSMPEQKIPA